MAFTKTWSEADLKSTKQRSIDDLTEDTRIGLRERANVEHLAYATEGANLDVWLHRKEAARCNFGIAANIPVAPTAVGTSGLVTGALYYETDTGLLKYYNGSAWVTLGSPNHSSIGTTYATGTVTVTNASAVVTGSGTAFSTNVTTADVFKGPDGEYYGITSVDSTVQITLDRAYDGEGAAGQSYTIYLAGHPQYVKKSGDTMDAALAMGASKITGLAAATANGDAVRYEQVIGVFAKVKIGTYTGDASATRAITGVGFQPEFLTLWEKTTGVYVRYKSNQDTTYAKNSNGGYWEDEIISLDADGFTVGDGTGGGVSMNASAKVYVYRAERYSA